MTKRESGVVDFSQVKARHARRANTAETPPAAGVVDQVKIDPRAQIRIDVSEDIDLVWRHLRVLRDAVNQCITIANRVRHAGTTTYDRELGKKQILESLKACNRALNAKRRGR